MEEGEQGKSWLIWVLIVPVAMAAGGLLTKWALQPDKAARPAAEEQAEARPAPAPFPKAAAPAAPGPAASAGEPEDLPGDEPSGDAGIIWANKPAGAALPGEKTSTGSGGVSSGGAGSSTASKPAAPDPAAKPEDAKKSQSMGMAYGAISKAVGKLMNNPEAVAAILNNKYVVKGFMSRDTVRNATRNSASLAAYLKNPANLNNFMGKDVVQRGMDNRELVNAVAGSQLVGALLDTPGGKALLNDPAAIADIMRSNPGMIDVLKNPAILSALVSNPKTSGVVSSITMPGIPR